MQMRFNGGKPFDGTIVEHPERLADILPKSLRRAPRVWTYWNDLFHPGVSNEFRDKLHRMIGHSDDYHIICTKRPEEVVKYWQRSRTAGALPIRKKKLIYLITIENQEMAWSRVPHAAELALMGWTVGALIEPMLGPVVIDRFVLSESGPQLLFKWIICGPENGPGKRQFKQEWAMRLQSQAMAANIPFFYKDGLLNGKEYLEAPEAW